MSPAGCRADRESEDGVLVAESLRRYNRALAEAYLTGSPESLAAAASDREAQKVGVLVDALRSQGQILLASLEDLRVAEVSFAPGGRARAATKERWSYERVDHKTRVTVVPRKIREYAMVYRLERRGAGWVVLSAQFDGPSSEAPP